MSNFKELRPDEWRVVLRSHLCTFRRIEYICVLHDTDMKCVKKNCYVGENAYEMKVPLCYFRRRTPRHVCIAFGESAGKKCTKENCPIKRGGEST